MGGTAVKFLAGKLLGKDNATESELADYIETADPSQLLELKKLDTDYKVQMKKLEMEQNSSNEDGQSPPACQAVHASLKAEVSAMQTKLGLVEKKLLFVDDFDPEDLERRVKKLSKNVKALQEEIE